MTNNLLKNKYTAVLGSESRPGPDQGQSSTDLSNEPDAICVLSLENATDKTGAVWPLSSPISTPVDASYTCKEDKPLPHDTILVLSLENATVLTHPPVDMVINGKPILLLACVIGM